jgi:hypothetical protein
VNCHGLCKAFRSSPELEGKKPSAMSAGGFLRSGL